ncbi:FixH family protein [Lysobacter koreensis]|uniref:FixH family protein n=1 Tax=Lysobacter koreensis TaxID=266122 RepID=A0ABW2YHC0_9GAMM
MPIQPPSPATPPGHASPWRQPIVWLVVVLVAAAVIGGILMVIVANDGSTDAVSEPVQRMAQVQTTDLGPDGVARNEKLSAIVRVDAERGLVEVLPVSGPFDRAVPLQLSLAHPTHASADRVLRLQPTELGWRTEASVDGSHDWNVQLGPADARWRLRGRLPKGQQATNLRPALPDR